VVDCCGAAVRSLALVIGGVLEISGVFLSDAERGDTQSYTGCPMRAYILARSYML
jgi:hypothetical protein